MIGRVISTKMQKTVSVLVSGKKTHPLYKKTFVWSKKYLVHDELGTKEGDIVSIIPTRPISKRKYFKVEKIIGKDVIALGEAAMKQVEEEAIAEVMPVEEESKESEAAKETKVEAEAVTEKKAEKKTKKVAKKGEPK